MPSVSVPAALEPLFPFVKRARVKLPNACFESYADLLVFSACLGFHRCQGKPGPSGAARTNQIEPVDLEYFGRDRHQTALHFISLLAGGGTEAVDDPEQLCRLIEDFAEVGGQELMTILKRGGASSFHLELGELLLQAHAEAQLANPVIQP